MWVLLSLHTLAWHGATRGLQPCPQPGEHFTALLGDALISPRDAQQGGKQTRGCGSTAGQTPPQRTLPTACTSYESSACSPSKHQTPGRTPALSTCYPELGSGGRAPSATGKERTPGKGCGVLGSQPGGTVEQAPPTFSQTHGFHLPLSTLA